MAEVIKAMYDFRRIYLETGDDDQLEVLEMDQIQKSLLKKRLDRLRQSFSNAAT